MKKQIGICALIAVLVLVAVGCASFTEETEYITNTAFITAVEEETDIDWTKEEDGTVPLTRENLKAIRAVTELDINHKKLTDLSGIEWFSELEVLNCSDNRLTELDLSQNSNLWSLRCNSNQLRSLDLSQNTTLKDLECNSNQLTELDLPKNTLIVLECYSNRLTELDLSHNSVLDVLECGHNQLTELDLSRNRILSWLECNSNQLTELDLSHNTALVGLDCSSNRLIELDLSHNTSLVALDCNSNYLTKLDVSNNIALAGLLCINNQLSELDLSHNTALEELYCGSQKTSGGEVQELVLSLTVEQREIWDSYWASARIDKGSKITCRWVEFCGFDDPYVLIGKFFGYTVRSNIAGYEKE